MPCIQARQHIAGQAQGPSPGYRKMPAGQAVASEAPSAVSLPMHHGCRNAQWSCLGQAWQPTCSDACRISRLRLSTWVISASLSSVVSRPARSLALSSPCVALAACEYDSFVFRGPFGPPVAQKVDLSGMLDMPNILEDVLSCSHALRRQSHRKAHSWQDLIAHHIF